MSTRERIVLLLSGAVLVFFYGFGASQWGWFPGPVIQRAVGQAQRITAPPDFVSPRSFERSGVRILDREAMQPGLTLIASMWEQGDGRWSPGLRLVDVEGTVLHEWVVDPGAVLPEWAIRRAVSPVELDIHGVHLFPDGDVLVNIEYGGTVRLGPCGEVRWSLPRGSHHSIAPADDGTFWIPAVTQERVPASPHYPEGYPGIVGTSYQDLILRVSGEGEVRQAISVLDILYENDLERPLHQAWLWNSKDITHINDAEPLPDSLAEEYPLFRAGDLLISIRKTHQVLVFDPTSLEVKWHTSHLTISQHDPDFLGEGWIGIFDNATDGTNRGQRLGGSRILALKPGTDSVKVLFPTSRSESFYTPLRGKWQMLENGNMLLTESGPGRVVEVAPDGTTVWDWVHAPYDEEHVPLVSEGLRVDLTAEQVAAWPCSTVNSSEMEGSS